MQAITSRFTVATVCFILAACGGSSGSGGSSGTTGLEDDGGVSAAVNSGVIVAPRVSGLQVGSGLTTANGTFSLSGDQLLDIKLGSLDISSVTARSRLSVYDLIGSAAQYRFDKAVRVGRLLISLDSDSDARNGVQLDATDAYAGELDWEYADGLWQSSADSLLYRLSDGSKTLLSADDAMQTMADHQRAESEVCVGSLNSSADFSISDPSCSDRARMKFWLNDLSPAMLQFQSGLDQFLNQQLTANQWWSANNSEWQALLDHPAEAQAWLSYVLAGADVPTRETMQDSLAFGGSLSAAQQTELERWRDGGATVLRSRDQQERELAAHVLQAWLGYGFDQQAMRTAHNVNSGSDWQGFIESVATQQAVSTASLRLAVVDQQVYLALELLDAMMNASSTWVTGGSSAPDDGMSSDDSGGGGSSDGSDIPARVWRVSYADLLSGQAAEFSVEGSALDSDVGLILSGCNNIETLSGNASSRVFSCDLIGEAGGRVLQVLDENDGSLLYEAIVSVAGSSSDDGSQSVVVSVSPSKAERSSTQIFKILGQNLSANTGFSLAGCSDETVVSRSSTVIEIECVLDNRATVRAGQITDADGEEIYPFNVSPLVIDEALMRVLDIDPAAALEAETVTMTITGSGFGDNVQVQSAACESTTLLDQSDIELRFRCRNAKLGTWPVYVVSEQQTVTAPQSIQVRSVEAVVTDVSPLTGVVGEWVNLKVSGQYLSAGLQIDLAGCTEMEELNGSTVQRQFGCIPQDSGVVQGQVFAGDRLLYRFDFNVEATSSSEVTDVQPSSSNYGEPLQLVFSGVDLPELAQVELDGCFNTTLLSATNSRLVFTCTPQQVGALSGNLLNANADVLASFTVNIVDNSSPIDSIVLSSVQPTSTYIDALTTFTVRGEELPASMVISVEDCTAVERLGGQSTQRQFRCTPKGASGVRKITVYASEGGAQLGSFDLTVTGNEMLVTGVSPAKTAVGVKTTFRVRGLNLTSSLVLEVDGCDARLTGSSSTESRIYSCTPYGVAGTRTIRVLERAGGTVLYSQAVEFLPAP